MSRCFAFGCSFTKWYYPTWADYIGCNFDEFYNYAQGGTSNTTQFQRFIEVDKLYKFTKDDVILFGLTGFSRYNFFLENKEKETFLFGCGPFRERNDWIDDHHKYKHFSDIIKFVRDYFWKDKWGVYYSWLAVNTVKRICDGIGCKVYFIPGLDISQWEDKGHIIINEQEEQMFLDIQKHLVTTMSLQVYDQQNYKKMHPVTDQHPFFDANWGYVNKYFPEYVTSKSKEFYNEVLEKFHEGVNNKTFQTQDDVYDFLPKYKKQLNGWKEDRKLYGTYM